MAEDWRDVVTFLGKLLEKRRENKITLQEIYNELERGITKFQEYEGLFQFLRKQYWSDEKIFIGAIRSASLDIAQHGASETVAKNIAESEEADKERYERFENARRAAQKESGIIPLPLSNAIEREARKSAAEREASTLRCRIKNLVRKIRIR